MGISDHLTYLLRNLCAGQEATVKTRHGTADWFKIGTGIHQGYILSPCLFNSAYSRVYHAKFQAGWNTSWIKIARRNINSLRYADETTLMAESKEEIKILLMKVKEESEKAGLKLSIQKTKIIACSPIISWQIDGKGKWKQWQTLLSWASKSLWMVTVAMKLKDICSLEEKQWQS